MQSIDTRRSGNSEICTIVHQEFNQLNVSVKRCQEKCRGSQICTIIHIDPLLQRALEVLLQGLGHLSLQAALHSLSIFHLTAVGAARLTDLVADLLSSAIDKLNQCFARPKFILTDGESQRCIAILFKQSGDIKHALVSVKVLIKFLLDLVIRTAPD